MSLKAIDLFAGTGAFTLALSENDIEVVFSNDMIEESKDIYNANFSHQLTKKNLLDIDVGDIPPHDILCGGFPCQPFSIAGNRLGFEDERSNVFWKILAIAKHHKTKCLVLENVKNLQGHDKGNTFKKITESLEELGYTITFKVIDTSKYSHIPQHRERIYMVCLLEDKDFSFSYLTNEENLPLASFLEDNIDDKYYYGDRFKIWEKLEEFVNKKNTIYQYRRYYVRENKSNMCPTLTANMGGGGHNVPIIKDDKGIRKLTPRECFNLQGFDKTYIFPENMSDTKLYKLAGNAVSVPIVRKLIQEIIVQCSLKDK